MSRRPAVFFAVLNIPVRARGSSHTSIALMMEDSGADENFITQALARKLQLGRSPATNSSRTGGQEEYAYFLEVVDARGIGRPIEASRHRLHQEHPPGRGRGRSSPTVPKAAAAAFIRPHGSVDLLIVMKNRELHCKGRFRQGCLTHCKTIFKQQWILTGQSPSRETTPGKGSPERASSIQDCTIPRRFKDAIKKWEHDHHPRNLLRKQKLRCMKDHGFRTTSKN